MRKRAQKARRQLYIMLKEPRPGRVKTRLGRDIGHVTAAWWFRHQVQRLLRRLAHDPRWKTILAVAPDREGRESRVWPNHIARQPQGAGDLGARMRRIFRHAPPGPVVIIGADIPGIAASDIAEAFGKLGAADAVLGPAPDGGYWLIGLSRANNPCPSDLFENVRWSTATARADTISSLPKTARIEFLASHQDVDTAQDLARLQRGCSGSP